MRGLARELGISPVYVWMLASGQRAMTRVVGGVIEAPVNSESVHDTVPVDVHSAPGSSFLSGSRGRTRTYDQSINSRPLYH